MFFKIFKKFFLFKIKLYSFNKSLSRKGCGRESILMHSLEIKKYMLYSCIFTFKLIGIITVILDGAKRTRTADPLHAMQVLYQLSYGPKFSNVNHLFILEIFF